MRLSVLVQCYNHEPYLEEALRSVYMQDLRDTEVIVVDDGSPDNSAELLKKLQGELGFELIVQKNRGFIPTLNDLLKRSEGSYVCILSGDDFFPPHKFSEQLEYMDSHPECSVLLGNSIVVNADSKILKKQNQLFINSCDSELVFEDVFLGRKRVGAASALFRKSALESIDAFPPDVVVEDLWAWLRLLRNGHKVMCMNKNWAFYRLHGFNFNQRSLLMQEKVLSIIGHYSDHPQYKKALRFWKVAFFSQLAINNKMWAIKNFHRYLSVHPQFILGCVKLLIPLNLYRKIRSQN